jgi:hypothetical protein
LSGPVDARTQQLDVRIDRDISPSAKANFVVMDNAPTIPWAPREWRHYILPILDQHGDAIHRGGRLISGGKWAAPMHVEVPADLTGMPEDWVVLWKHGTRELISIYHPRLQLNVYHHDLPAGPEGDDHLTLRLRSSFSA